jgi:hypothetical protein
MLRTSRSRLAASACVAAVLGGVAVAPAPAGAAAAQCSGRTTVGRWTYVASPVWPPDDNEGMVPVGDRTNPGSWPSVSDGSQTVIGPGNPRRILLSNHRSLLRSLDGGCTWTMVFSLTPGATTTDPMAKAAALVGVPGAQIAQVAVPRSAAATASAVVYLMIQLAAYPGVYAVLRSADDGQTWRAVTPYPTGTASGTRLPQPGLPRYLEPAPSNPNTAYLCVNCNTTDVGAPPPVLHVTHDGGSTWATASLPALAAGDSFGRDTSYHSGTTFTVDPVDPASVWLRTLRGVYHSADSGGHWETVLADIAPMPADADYPNVAPVAVFRRTPAAAPSVVVSLLAPKTYVPASVPQPATAPAGLVSYDGGRHWQRLPDLSLTRLGFGPRARTVGPLALSFDAAGRISGYLVDIPRELGLPTRSAVLLLRGSTWQVARPPNTSATYAYSASGVFTQSFGSSSLIGIGLDGAHGTVPALVQFDMPR